jgi:hypothetical protein
VAAGRRAGGRLPAERVRRGEPPPQESAKQVLGMVVEMALPEGLDLLAVYADGSVRYYG